MSRLVLTDGSLLFMSCFPSVVYNQDKACDRADAGKSTKYDKNCRKSDLHYADLLSLIPEGCKCVSPSGRFREPPGHRLFNRQPSRGTCDDGDFHIQTDYTIIVEQCQQVGWHFNPTPSANGVNADSALVHDSREATRSVRLPLR